MILSGVNCSVEMSALTSPHSYPPMLMAPGHCGAGPKQPKRSPADLIDDRTFVALSACIDFSCLDNIVYQFKMKTYVDHLVHYFYFFFCHCAVRSPYAGAIADRYDQRKLAPRFYHGAAYDYWARYSGVGPPRCPSAGTSAFFSATIRFCGNCPYRLRNSLLDGLRNVPFVAFVAAFIRRRSKAEESPNNQRNIDERGQSILDHLVGSDRSRVYPLFQAVWFLGHCFFLFRAYFGGSGLVFSHFGCCCRGQAFSNQSHLPRVDWSLRCFSSSLRRVFCLCRVREAECHYLMKVAHGPTKRELCPPAL